MKKSLRLLSLALALVFMLGILAGCKKDKEEPAPTDTTSAAEPTIPTVDVNLAEYTIVRPSDISSSYIQSVVDFKKALEEKLGVSVGISEDFLLQGQTPDAAAKEILVGLTNREESTTVYNELGEDFAFIVKVIGNKICVAAPTVEMLNKGLDFMVENSKVEGGTISVPENYTSNTFGYTEIVSAGVPQYKVVYSQSLAGTSGYDSVKKINAAIDKVADTDSDISDDWKRADQPHDLTQKAIVVGDTTYDKSIDMAKSCGYFAYRIESLGKQIYLYGKDLNTVDLLCDKMVKKIENGVTFSNKKTVRICDIEAESGTSVEWANSIPVYNGGKLDSVSQFSTDYYRLNIEDTTRAEYDAYVAGLAQSGYTLYQTNALGDNAYNTYKNDKLMLHAYYMAKEEETRILVTELANFVDYPTAPVADAAVTTRKLSMADMDYASQSAGNNGMGFVYTLADGSYVIVDGGYATEAEPLYNYLNDYNKRSDGIVIRAWIITHGDGDHYGCLKQFAEHYAHLVKVEYMVAQFDYEQSFNSSEGPSVVRGAQAAFRAKYITPLAGQKMYFGELEVDFLYTSEMLYPDTSTDNNNHSLVMKTYLDGKSILITGDALNVPIRKMIKNYGNLLKSDYCQLPHHGLVAGNKQFWDLVDPSYVFINTSKYAAQSRLESNESFLKYLVTEKNVQEVYIADDGWTVVVFSYTGPEFEADADYDTNKDAVEWEDFIAG